MVGMSPNESTKDEAWPNKQNASPHVPVSLDKADAVIDTLPRFESLPSSLLADLKCKVRATRLDTLIISSLDRIHPDKHRRDVCATLRSVPLSIISPAG